MLGQGRRQCTHIRHTWESVLLMLGRFLVRWPGKSHEPILTCTGAAAGVGVRAAFRSSCFTLRSP